MEVRLQKLIAGTGLASRRKSEELIISGRVMINGRVVKELGTKVDPDRDHVKVDGKHLRAKQPYVYLILNKPKNVMSTLDDPEGRPTVKDLLQGVTVRVFPVGRLDFDSEGLMLLTNHGDLAQALLHPRYHVPKTYLIKVKGVLDDAKIETLERGVKLEDGFTAPAKVSKVSKAESNSWLEVTIHEGRKHQVKRMVETVGHSVIKLVRTRMGPLLLGDLAPREYRFLTDREANRLRKLAEDRVSRVERLELDSSGHPSRWMPPTAPAPPRQPKPERSGRGAKSDHSGRGSRSLGETKPSRSGRGPARRPLNPGARFRRPRKGTQFLRAQAGEAGQGFERGQASRSYETEKKPQRTGSEAGAPHLRPRLKPPRSGRGATVSRTGPGQQTSPQNRRDEPLEGRPGRRGPERQSRYPTRRKA